ncbi:MAG: NAD-dependent epimerase/dehydratase family protein [Candidatus Moraniibacteriota bacterium]
MKCLITGSSGFIGSHLADELRKRGHEIFGMDVIPPKWNNIPTKIGSVTSKEDVYGAMEGMDFVFHLAGKLGTHELVDAPIEAAKINIIGTLTVLDACKNFGTKIIGISKPNCWVNTYTITKVAAESFIEMYRREHKVKAAIVKWFNVYGARQPLEEESGYKKLIPTAIVNALRNTNIEIYGNGEQTMDLVHTTDTINATVAVMENWGKCEGGVFEIGVGQEFSVNEVVNQIIRLTDSRSKITHIPMRKGEWENTHIKADISNLKKMTGWEQTVSLEQGLIETIQWYKEKYV